MSYIDLSELMDIETRAPLGCEAVVRGRRCGRAVIGSFSICAATKGYVLVCARCDVAINRAVLSTLGLPNVGQRIAAYRRFRIPRITKNWRRHMKLVTNRRAA